MSEVAQPGTIPPNYVPVSEWAIRYGFRESEIHHRIRAGILDGVELDGVWYVVRTLKNVSAPSQPSSSSQERSTDDIFSTIHFDRTIPRPERTQEASRAWHNSNTTYHPESNVTTGLLMKWFAPRYDDLTLFIMSFSALIVFGLNKTLRADLYENVINREEIVFPYLLFPLFLIGLGLSLKHAIVAHHKYNIEKELMLYFAVFLQATTGVVAAFLILRESVGFAIFFPLWNMLSVSILMYFYFYRDENNYISHITDGTHCRTQVVIAAIAVIAIILVCNYLLALHWAITLSISIAVASSLSEAIDLMISPAKT